MKPSVIAALVFRLLAVLWVLSTLISVLAPVLLGVLTRLATATPTMGTVADFRSPSLLGGLGGLQVAICLVSVVGGVLLYIWSPLLGRVTARGL